MEPANSAIKNTASQHQLIKTINTYISTTGEENDYISSVFKLKTFNKGDFLFEAGDVCRYFYFINSGLIRYFLFNDGEELTYNFSSEDEFVCDYMSFLDQSPSEKNVQCLESTEVLAISYNDLQQFYFRVAEGQKFGRLCMEKFYIGSIKQIKSLYADKPGRRYLNFLANYPNINSRVPQYYISSYVGVKPQSLSRIRRRLV